MKKSIENPLKKIENQINILFFKKRLIKKSFSQLSEKEIKTNLKHLIKELRTKKLNLAS